MNQEVKSKNSVVKCKYEFFLLEIMNLVDTGTALLKQAIKEENYAIVEPLYEALKTAKDLYYEIMKDIKKINKYRKLSEKVFEELDDLSEKVEGFYAEYMENHPE